MGGEAVRNASRIAARTSFVRACAERDQHGGVAVEGGIVTKPGRAIASNASLASRFSTVTARISPAGGVSSPNHTRSALLNGRRHATPLPTTIRVRWAHRVPTVTPGSFIANTSTTTTAVQQSSQHASPPGWRFRWRWRNAQRALASRASATARPLRDRSSPACSSTAALRGEVGELCRGLATRTRSMMMATEHFCSTMPLASTLEAGTGRRTFRV